MVYRSVKEIIDLIRQGDVAKIEPDVLKSFIKLLPDNSEVSHETRFSK
jgi:hypothetical protein